MKQAAHTLYLVRHAIAEERGPEWPDDSVRPLTRSGVERFQKVARGFASLGPDVGIILTSGFTRARQTAHILGACLPGRPEVVEIEALEAGRHFADVLSALLDYAVHPEIVLVGHEPGIGALAGHLLGHSGSLEFKKGGICRIDVAGLPLTAPGRLRWFMPPRVLERLR